MKKPAKLKDVADALGINASTVSRAMSNHPRIPEATRERVRAKAAELGYRPDPALRRLAERRWAAHPSTRPVSLALVVWSKSDYPLLQKALKKPVKAAVEELGYGFELFFADDYPDVASVARVMQARGVCGIAVLASENEQAWKGFPWEQFSAVQILSGEEQPTGLLLIQHDSFGTLLDAGDRVIQARPASAVIGLLRQPHESSTDLQDHAAALLVTERWKAAGIACKGPRFFEVGKNLAKTFVSWLVKERAEVAVVPNSGIVWMLERENLSVPEDLRIISLWRQDNPSFAGYERRLDTIALRAVQKLDSLVRHDERGLPESPQITTVTSVWVPGDSFPEP